MLSPLDRARRIVIKIGSALLVDRETGQLRDVWLESLVVDVVMLRARDVQVVIVSSGSIALGREILGLGDQTLTLDQAQAAASVGQIRLARAYAETLAPHGINAAQVLVTLDDSDDRRRYLNMRATMQQLLRLGAVPIVNENDTVATDEIRYGDNDRLAAQIAVTLEADCLILLSDVDGLYTANPNEDLTARHLAQIDAVTPEIEIMAGEAASVRSKGGMKTKIMAAKLAMVGGCSMAITQGAPLHPVDRLLQGGRATWFTPKLDPQTARKRWISAMKPKGSVTLDRGAVCALHVGKSLLPAGVLAASGDFERGDPVSIREESGHEIGRGLCRYSCKETLQIRKRHSREIADILGYPGRASLIHRDDMALDEGALAKPVGDEAQHGIRVEMGDEHARS